MTGNMQIMSSFCLIEVISVCNLNPKLTFLFLISVILHIFQGMWQRFVALTLLSTSSLLVSCLFSREYLSVSQAHVIFFISSHFCSVTQFSLYPKSLPLCLLYHSVIYEKGQVGCGFSVRNEYVTSAPSKKTQCRS